MRMRSTRIWVATLACLLFLQACETAEERAEKHFASAKELVAEGDVDRAFVELRNVFKLNGQHKEARLLYANLQEERGNLEQAISNYRLLAEQYPDMEEVHQALGRLALQIADWDGAERHGRLAYEMDSEDPENQALYAAILFRSGERDESAKLVEQVLAANPSNAVAQSLRISAALEAQDFERALELTDAALAALPEDEGINLIKLNILSRLDRQEDVARHLEHLIALYPDNPQLPQALIQHYIRTGQQAKAEDLLRERARQGGTDEVLSLVRFMVRTDGTEAALEEVRKRADGAEGDDRVVLRRTEAGLMFELGQRDEAVELMRSLITVENPNDTIRETTVLFAKMLNSVNRGAEADEMIEAVLATDPDVVEALKMRAAKLIQMDDTDGAIRDLRRALDQDSRDPEILTLMANAHFREGANELAGERLALAVEVSGNAVSESVRYANYLLENDRVGPAESVVVDALRLRPDEPALLDLLGRIHLQRRDFERVDQVIALLEEVNTTETQSMATRLRHANLRAQERTDDAIALLEGLASEGGRTANTIPLIRTLLQEGRVDEAEARLGELAAEHAGDPVVRLMQAGVAALKEDNATAEAGYKSLIADFPQAERVHLAYYGYLARQGRRDEATKALDAGLAATNRSGQLLLAKAGELERAGAFEDTIQIYEELYGRNTNNLLIANNLASMLATHRTDAASLDRAYTIARRLRGTEVVPFQDTYGWILARRGEYEEALAYLEPAAKGLPNDPLVQYHLGIAQAGAGQITAAIETLSRAIEIAGPETDLPQMAAARERIAELRTAPATSAGQ